MALSIDSLVEKYSSESDKARQYKNELDEIDTILDGEGISTHDNSGRKLTRVERLVELSKKPGKP